MNLNALLSELRENILHDRSDRVAGQSDRLWSDVTLVRYINEAHRRFARESLILRDGAPGDMTTITLVTGQTQYALHDKVIAVVSAKFGNDRVDLPRAGHSAFDAYKQPDPYFFDTTQFATMAPGKPLAFSTDDFITKTGDDDTLSRISLRVFPEPSAEYNGQTIQLRVIRLPLEDLDVKTLQMVPEVPEDHHLPMLDWAAYLALRIVDVDAGFAARAQEFKASFDTHVKEARKMVMRKLFAPQQWGFGRNGFTWER